MKELKTISVTQFCTHYEVPVSFIESLNNYELIHIIEIQNDKHIRLEEVNTLERYIRLHYHLNINFEGLDVIANLLNQIEELQNKINNLNNKLDFYQ